MGLATSQVRLLALTSRKADVEMQIQLNSKRKTMLTRESTELSKLYYAKLQNSKIMYSTTNGNKDVTYEYLMAPDSAAFFDDVVNLTSSSGYERKTSDTMILTDAYGRVILSNTMADIMADVYNLEGGIPGNTGDKTVESSTLDAMKLLLERMSGGNDSSFIGQSSTAQSLNEVYKGLYDGSAVGGDATIGFNILQHLFRNGYQEGGILYKLADGTYCTNYKDPLCTKVTPQNGTFYKIKDASSLQYIDGDAGAQGSMYWGGMPIAKLTCLLGKQLCQALSYYGSIFSAAFSGNKIMSDGNPLKSNVSADIIKGSNNKYEVNTNDTYKTIKANTNALQDGLKSGLYQLVNVENRVTGAYSKAQGLNYFKTQNYVVEQTDNAERETITAWYNAARADLNTKESYWDSEITALSAELNSITTEIDSVKKLREDAISSTFKWGGA